MALTHPRKACKSGSLPNSLGWDRQEIIILVLLGSEIGGVLHVLVGLQLGLHVGLQVFGLALRYLTWHTLYT